MSFTKHLPVEMHIPGYSYCGPGTKLDKRLARGDKPVNKVDEVCMKHDIAYSKAKEKSESIAKKGIQAKLMFGLIFCLKCKEKTETEETKEKTLRNGKKMLQGLCTVCGSKKNRFLAKSSPQKS